MAAVLLIFSVSFQYIMSVCYCCCCVYVQNVVNSTRLSAHANACSDRENLCTGHLCMKRLTSAIRSILAFVAKRQAKHTHSKKEKYDLKRPRQWIVCQLCIQVRRLLLVFFRKKNWICIQHVRNTSNSKSELFPHRLFSSGHSLYNFFLFRLNSANKLSSFFVRSPSMCDD